MGPQLKYVARMKSGDALDAEYIHAEGTTPVYGGNGLRGYTEATTHNTIAPLIGRQGALCGNVHLAAGRFFATEHAIVAQPRKDVDPHWLYWALQPLDLGQYSMAAAQPGLAIEVIGRTRVSLPSLATQTAIANYLDAKTSAIDALIAKKEQLLVELKLYLEAVISEAVRPREGWSRTKIKHVVEPLPKSTLPAGEADDAGTIPFYISGKKVKRSFHTEYFNIEAVVLATGGLPAVHLAKGDFSYSSDCWGLIGKEGVSTLFLYYFLCNMAQTLAEDGFRGAGIKHLDKGWLLDYEIFAPTLEVQASLIQKLSHVNLNINKLMDGTKLSLENLHALRTSLISEAVTGKLALPE